jgi:ClpP class serine protease
MEGEIAEVATKLADATDSDVLLYSGDIERPYDDKLLDLCMERRRRKNVLLLLCTSGGNPDAAYRMARGLQDNYEKFTLLIGGRCKSAGTLIDIGAHELVMADHAELGPLDVQLGKERRAV